MGFWDACTHSGTTEPDEDGKALCTTCGAVHQVRLTRQVLMDGFEAMKRDHGTRGGHHSMRCVETPEGWCCADNCQIRR